MTILYAWLVGLPIVGSILKIRAKEYDFKFFLLIIIWITSCTFLWIYMEWFDLGSGKGFFDPDFIWKN
jgi:hypothetical protein